MKKENCWEFNNCPEGLNGRCPTSQTEQLPLSNKGDAAGRICWAVFGSKCVKDDYDSIIGKMICCSKCDFYHKVKEEEGLTFKLLPSNSVPFTKL
jgi:hypothetical protein